jgi:hypothetical protein
LLASSWHRTGTQPDRRWLRRKVDTVLFVLFALLDRAARRRRRLQPAA